MCVCLCVCVCVLECVSAELVSCACVVVIAFVTLSASSAHPYKNIEGLRPVAVGMPYSKFNKIIIRPN